MAMDQKLGTLVNIKIDQNSWYSPGIAAFSYIFIDSYFSDLQCSGVKNQLNEFHLPTDRCDFWRPWNRYGAQDALMQSGHKPCIAFSLWGAQNDFVHRPIDPRRSWLDLKKPWLP